MRNKPWMVLFLFVAAISAVSAAQTASNPLQGFLGDVTLDGAVNVNDVQAGIGKALGLSDTMPEADVNQDGQIDVRDVQHLVNSAIGNGGVFRRVTGRLENNTGATLLTAISDDGLRETVQPDPATGLFTLQLRTGRNWTLGVIEEATQNWLGSVRFPLGNVFSETLPISGLSDGANWNLGILTFDTGGTATANLDLNDIFPETQNAADYSASDLIGAVYSGALSPAYAAFIGDLGTQLAAVAARAGLLPEGAASELIELVAACANSAGEMTNPPVFPLEDADLDGVLDVVERIHACFIAQLPAWLDTLGLAGGPDSNVNGIADPFDEVLNRFAREAVTRLGCYAEQSSEDADNNGVPDWYDAATGATALGADIAPQYAQFIREAVRQSAWGLFERLNAPATGSEARCAALAQACFAAAGQALDTAPPPSQWISDTNVDGIKDVLTPMLGRFDGAVPAWLGTALQHWPSADANSNGIPDIVEQQVFAAAQTLSVFIDMVLMPLSLEIPDYLIESMLAPQVNAMYPWLDLPEGVHPVYGFAVAEMAQQLETVFVLPVALPAFMADTALEDLAGRIAACALSSGALGTGAASSADADSNGIPDMFEGISACLETQLPGWLSENGFSEIGAGFDWNDFLASIAASVGENTLIVLGDLGALACDDQNDNGIPDCIEASVFVPGVSTNILDANDNGIPDCFEDGDSDGIPNLLDPVTVASDDFDNDGILDDLDWDDDNDGAPDYCDAAPLDPNNKSCVPQLDNDLDHDGVNDWEDDDMDGDGVPNNADPAPRDPEIPQPATGA